MTVRLPRTRPAAPGRAAWAGGPGVLERHDLVSDPPSHESSSNQPPSQAEVLSRDRRRRPGRQATPNLNSTSLSDFTESR